MTAAIPIAVAAGLLGGGAILALTKWLPRHLVRQEAEWLLELTGQPLAQTPPLPDGTPHGSIRPLSIGKALVVMVAVALSIACIMPDGWTVPAAFYMVLAWSLIALGLIDLRTHLLPDMIVLPILWLGLLLQTIGGFETIGIKSAVWGAAAGYMLLWLPAAIFRVVRGGEAIGRGDFKLMAMIGAWLGPQNLVLTIMVSSSAAAIFHVAKGKARRAEFPFGPWLAAAALSQIPPLLYSL